jgi:ABC-type Fe3+-hydroxamate transport system substrate-binding protein
VVSLVPSLTEAVAATRPQALVGATDWCTRPAGLSVTRVRGTKNPDLRLIAALQPDAVLVTREENRQLDVERLRAAGVPVWVSVIETVDEAFGSLRRMFCQCLGWPVPAWVAAAEAAWAAMRPLPARRVVVPIWRDPWMVVGARTFTGDMLTRLGLVNAFGDAPGRYPAVTPAEIQAARPDLVILPDEPYQFSASDGPEALPGLRTALVSGRALTWYGPSLLEAPAYLTAQLG